MSDVPRPSQSPYLSGFMYVCFHIQGAQTLICLPVAGQGGAPRRFQSHSYSELQNLIVIAFISSLVRPAQKPTLEGLEVDRKVYDTQSAVS